METRVVLPAYQFLLFLLNRRRAVSVVEVCGQLSMYPHLLNSKVCSYIVLHVANKFWVACMCLSCLRCYLREHLDQIHLTTHPPWHICIVPVFVMITDGNDDDDDDEDDYSNRHETHELADASSDSQV